MKRKVLFAIVIATLMACGDIYAQGVGEFLKSKSTPSVGEYYKKYHSRIPLVDDHKAILGENSAAKEVKSKKSVEMPEKFWFPGEFEEVQAILITWPYVHVDKSYTYYVTPVDDSLGFRETNFGSYQVTSYVSLIDTTDGSRFPVIFAQLANAIQKGNAQVWINICNSGDSLIIKRYMNNQGMPLTNYRFFVNKGNSFWYRDCGPVGFYEGDNDDLSFLDFEYYGGRPVDDMIPVRIANELGINAYTTTLEFEGGNILLDGAGTLFTSDQIYAANEDRYGRYYISNNQVKITQKTSLTESQIHDTLIHLLGLNRLKVLPALVADGGTGHIDLYASMWDENNFVFTEYPFEMMNHADYTISSDNIDTILSLHNFHNKYYRGKNIPLPLKDDETWYTSADDFELYTRTYSNSTFVNNVIIQPIFSDDTWGARQWDLQALEIMKRQFPGYEIIPIDIRGFEGEDNANTGFDGTGGAIHCITKQIPAENPIRILHGSIQGVANEYENVFPLTATITNKSGIASATCFWRVKGSESWEAIAMTVDTGNVYLATIQRDSNVSVDTIEYYISATSNNGKTITKPFTAPKGYYTFYYGEDVEEEVEADIYEEMPEVKEPTGIESFSSIGEDDFGLSSFYPNPANEQTSIAILNMNHEKLNIRVINMLGQTVYMNSITPDEDQTILQIRTSSFSPGLYSVVFSDASGTSIVKKLMIQR